MGLEVKISTTFHLNKSVTFWCHVTVPLRRHHSRVVMYVGWEQRVTVATGDSFLSSCTQQPTEVRDMDYNANRWHSPFLSFVKIQYPVFYTCVLILKVEGAFGLATLSAGRKRNSKGANAGPPLSRGRGVWAQPPTFFTLVSTQHCAFSFPTTFSHGRLTFC